MTYTAAELEALRRLAFGRCRAAGATVEDAQDCAQEAVAALLANPAVVHPRSWISTVAYHRYVDICRLRGKESADGLVPASASRMSELAGPEEEVVGRVFARWLVGGMKRLPTSTRAVCRAVDAGQPRPVIAIRFGITERAVESHLTRARRQLRGLSQLGVVGAVVLGRLFYKAAPVGKPITAAAVITPSLAVLLTIGGSDAPDGARPGLAGPPALGQAAVGQPAEPAAPRYITGLAVDRSAVRARPPGHPAAPAPAGAPLLPELPALAELVTSPADAVFPPTAVLPDTPLLPADAVLGGAGALTELQGVPETVPLPGLPPVELLPTIGSALPGQGG